MPHRPHGPGSPLLRRRPTSAGPPVPCLLFRLPLPTRTYGSETHASRLLVSRRIGVLRIWPAMGRSVVVEVWEQLAAAPNDRVYFGLARRGQRGRGRRPLHRQRVPTPLLQRGRAGRGEGDRLALLVGELRADRRSPPTTKPSPHGATAFHVPGWPGAPAGTPLRTITGARRVSGRGCAGSRCRRRTPQ